MCLTFYWQEDFTWHLKQWWTAFHCLPESHCLQLGHGPLKVLVWLVPRSQHCVCSVQFNTRHQATHRPLWLPQCNLNPEGEDKICIYNKLHYLGSVLIGRATFQNIDLPSSLPYRSPYTSASPSGRWPNHVLPAVEVLSKLSSPFLTYRCFDDVSITSKPGT